MFNPIENMGIRKTFLDDGGGCSVDDGFGGNTIWSTTTEFEVVEMVAVVLMMVIEKIDVIDGGVAIVVEEMILVVSMMKEEKGYVF
ncbi:hypothetical protein C5167_025584 [Papaver somniferum]|uniref:Uncharacterized protein n=1 Tax=Papaver somniferum TaxID=3469 RepID=A0A4Y7JV49_PAPSO|nr:hypothetical protein C5167_025584 [Papaver somniferum]